MARIDLVGCIEKRCELEAERNLDDLSFVADPELQELAALARRDRNDTCGDVAERPLDLDERFARRAAEVAAKHRAVIGVNDRACAGDSRGHAADRAGFGEMRVHNVRRKLPRDLGDAHKRADIVQG